MTQNGTIIVDLYKNKEGTVLRNQPREIPLTEIGKWYRQERMKPTTLDKVIKGSKAVISDLIK